MRIGELTMLGVTQIRLQLADDNGRYPAELRMTLW